MKLTYEEKYEIYCKWKYEGYDFTTLGHLYGVSKISTIFLIRLADKHGVETFKHKWTYYPPKYQFIPMDAEVTQTVYAYWSSKKTVPAEWNTLFEELLEYYK